MGVQTSCWADAATFTLMLLNVSVDQCALSPINKLNINSRLYKAALELSVILEEQHRGNMHFFTFEHIKNPNYSHYLGVDC